MQGVKFFPFPKPWIDAESCRKWLRACGRPYEQLNERKIAGHHYFGSKVCKIYKLSCVTTKTVFRISNQSQHKPCCKAKDGKRLEILDRIEYYQYSENKGADQLRGYRVECFMLLDFSLVIFVSITYISLFCFILK